MNEAPASLWNCHLAFMRHLHDSLPLNCLEIVNADTILLSDFARFA